MILADGINLPIVLFLGLVTIGPLTLLVVAIEMLVFRTLYGIRLRASFRPLLAANILSTAAGLVVYMFQDGILYAVGVRTAADFAHKYLWGALALIGLYFVVSVVVEGVYIARQRYAETFSLRRGRIWRAIFAANVASYALMGPVFYFSTRPTFHGLQFVDNPASIAQCQDTIYFIGTDNGHLYRVQADGQGLIEAVPYEVRDFLVSADQSAYLYRGADGNLWLFRRGDSQPKCIWQTRERFHMTEVDLSADKGCVAYTSLTNLVVYEVAAERIIAQAELSGQKWHPVGLLAWDADNPDLLHTEAMWSDSQDWEVGKDSLTRTTASASHLVGNFRRCMPGSSWGGQDDWGAPLPFVQQQGELTLRTVAGLGMHIWVGTGQQPLALFHNDYGLLGFGYPGANEACFLSAPGVVLCSGTDCLYILNAPAKRLAELARGRKFVITNSQFQASLPQKPYAP